MHELFTVYLVITAVLDFVFFILFDEGNKSIAGLLNPIAIYKNIKVNVFGCMLLTVLGNVFFIWIAPFYWIYKLCTVGRK